MTEQEVLDILGTLEHPGTHKKLSEISKIEGISQGSDLLKIRLLIEDLQPDEKKGIRTLIEDSFTKKGIDVLVSITTNSSIQPKPAPSNPHIKPFLAEGILSRFKKIIAVYSTKGGVGKSTVAASLVKDFATKGLKTAIVDLDIYGPSIPRILGMKGQVAVYEQKFVPAEIDGIHMMSVGLLIPNVDSPLIWRAPIVNGVISQIFTDTLWDDEYDVLVIDMPPGTGDIPILVGQSIPPDGVLVVSTPQAVALEDTFKGLVMFQKFNVPILGFVYNMGTVVCDGCHRPIPLFNKSAEFDELMMNYQIDVIAELPLDPKVAALADIGDLDQIEEDWYWKQEFSKISDHLITTLELQK
ncbi:MAG: P-loop NTPase [Brevinema sp.]